MAQVKDPVCGMVIDSETTKLKSEYMGKTYYFCAPGCKVAFDKAPEKYVPPDQGARQHHVQ
ncbi:MAG TPA: YHS domain-containing protein [Chloroflexi bacterium]|nr:YHS domain-containing protein [Chloroflexota bacterium]HHW85313.1 YHS domain-containing protein [Chloroflexota bacterium]